MRRVNSPKLRAENKRREGKLYYFPERLMSHLAKIPDYPVTFVEAPSGFGKTTAMREYLKELGKNTPEDVSSFWHICLGEPPVKTWGGICELFSSVSMEMAESLRELGVPTIETIADIAEIARSYRASSETFLVVDNYQLFDCEIRREIAEAFSTHGDPALHVIFITQPLLAIARSFHSANIHSLRNADFSFDRNSTARLCRLFEMKLSEKELDYVQKISEGWVAVIRLQVETYRETGSFARMADMDDLIETAIWNRAVERDRELLISVALLDSFTPRQAAIMLDAPSIPQNAADLLRKNAFIPYSEEGGVYYMHAILQDFLKERFENAPDGFRFEALRRAGKACAATGDYYKAARFYARVSDYDAILSLPFSNQFFYNMERSIMEFFGRLLDECPEKILKRYPIMLLTIGNQFFKNGMRERFWRAVGLVRKIVEDPKGLSGRELARIKGELELAMFFTEFNDIAKMSEYHRKAYAYLKELSDPPRSLTFSGAIPSWTLGVPSVLCLYWRNSGELDKTLSVMDECVPIYASLTGGHGSGGEHIMRAEACLNRGDDSDAEALCYKAFYDARGAGQAGNCVCASLVMARAGIMRGDARMYEAARRGIMEEADRARQKAVSHMGELAAALLDMTLGRAAELPDWLCDIESIRNVLYIIGQPYAFALYGMILLVERRRAKLYAITELVMGISRGLNFLLPQVYHLIYLAVAKHSDGFGKEAAGRLKDALALALPDKIYLPFAEHGCFILPMLEGLRRDFSAERIDALAGLCRRQISGTEAVRKALYGVSSPLTHRQREIALLTREGLPAKEIAAKLFISENTVKSAQKIIYDKLNIHTKIELTKIEF